MSFSTKIKTINCFRAFNESETSSNTPETHGQQSDTSQIKRNVKLKNNEIYLFREKRNMRYYSILIIDGGIQLSCPSRCRNKNRLRERASCLCKFSLAVEFRQLRQLVLRLFSSSLFLSYFIQYGCVCIVTKLCIVSERFQRFLSAKWHGYASFSSSALDVIYGFLYAACSLINAV